MVTFSKMHGLGNDYICINTINDENILAENRLPQVVRYICNRNFGIGADGVILIQTSKIADVKMRIFNKDGTEAEMCGNGIRCFSKYVYDNKIIDKYIFTVETKAGIKTVKILRNNNIQEIEVDMGMINFNDYKNIKINRNYNGPVSINLKIKDQKFIGNYVSVGNPHLVIFVNNVDNININEYGPIIENMNCFPNKINVEFVQILGRNTIKLRVWERGVGETFACGTGAVAAFGISYYKGICGNKSKVLLKGGELNVRYDKSSNHIIMSGIATKVFDGKINI